MSIIQLAKEAASMKNWAVKEETDTTMTIDVTLSDERFQKVKLHTSEDGDGDSVVFIWSKAAEKATADSSLEDFLRLNIKLIYGRVALNNDDIIIAHALYDADAQLAEVGKTIYWVAKAADDLEKGNYGAYKDNL